MRGQGAAVGNQGGGAGEQRRPHRRRRPGGKYLAFGEGGEVIRAAVAPVRAWRTPLSMTVADQMRRLAKCDRCGQPPVWLSRPKPLGGLVFRRAWLTGNGGFQFRRVQRCSPVAGSQDASFGQVLAEAGGAGP